MGGEVSSEGGPCVVLMYKEKVSYPQQSMARRGHCVGGQRKVA